MSISLHRSDNDLSDIPIRPQKKLRESKEEIRCVPCSYLFSNEGVKDLNSPAGFTHRTYNGLSASSDEGCAMCQLLLEIGKREFGDHWAPDTSLTFRNEGMGPGINTLTACLGERQGDAHITLYPYAKKGDPASSIIPRRPLCRDVQSNAAFKAAQKLINSCLSPKEPAKGHKQCRYSRESVLPTRVLDVGDRALAEDFVRLQVNDTETHGSYLAFSYCWGNPNLQAPTQPLLLLQENLQTLTSKIELKDLQQSIQDAVFVTRRLGFRYLWVDALCIIQDPNSADKKHEISNMGAIYKNAAFTLAAGTAKRASESFLSPRTKIHPHLPEYKFNIPIENNKTGTVYISIDPYEPSHHLDKRAWALQEYMLSSRMLIFSDYDILWQCKQVELQSVLGNERGLEYRQPLESLPWTVFDEEAEPYYGTLDLDKLYLWMTIVRQYTSRDLTDSNDRLNAVAGVINELEKLWQDSNIYGHWKKWFIQLLTWYKPSGERTHKRHLQRAPSWSWVSLDGLVHYQEILEAHDARVVTVSMTVLTLNCRVLLYDDIAKDKLDSLTEQPDLESSHSLRELGNWESEYLLLGKVKNDGNAELGIGLLILPIRGGEYRRIGRVTFTDMSIWKGVRHRNISFEPRRLKI